ncbi:malonate decarboxylase holo-ACP synthase [Ligilactobacillus sp. WILCCON 0076]|uniref:Malonate decarboxylase holo-ACP synthase n=1 Tax=Ligilactobacillus ubinensis TaxID=2876789 RepID=A0A9X2JP98_9LACO|nr:malonate decarboxylase holo-ACP synthase [Ligilactobacillus ubinensis]MCP0887776.1 malonate decarboxylase holo-ACP synthase [Ligilactobacillus ubinensis]
MELIPHTLIKLKNKDLIYADTSVPAWVKKSLEISSYSVVRRGFQSEYIPVGIRGFKKNQRFAACIKKSNIESTYLPSDALKKIDTVPNTRLNLPAFQSLLKIRNHLSMFEWGVGGSLQFELITGIPMVTEKSDLDLLITCPPVPLSHKEANQLLKKLQFLSTVHLDIQVLNHQNGFSLEEFALQRNKTILVKTMVGPILMDDPWI